MPELVCLDSNAWYSESLLRSAVGSAVIYLITRTDRKLLLPELVERELEHVVVRNALDDLRKADDLRRRVKELLSRPRHVGPIESENDLRGAFRGRLRELSAFAEPMAITSDARQRAFDRVIDCRLPNSSKNQQAKDSLLWEQLMELPAGSSVVLVSGDQAFAEGIGKSRFLAKELSDDARRRGISIRLVKDCADFLVTSESIAPPVADSVVRSALANVMTSLAQEALDGVTLRRAPARVVGEPAFEILLFVTERPYEIAVSIRANAQAIENDSEPADFSFEAQAIFHSGSNEVSQTEVTKVWSVARSGIQSFKWKFEKDDEPAPELRVPVNRIIAGLSPRSDRGE
jgi:hypothetical protein